MGKSKRRSEPQDRLSELSDYLILHILSFLTMKDVVRTTLISKRWKDIWTTAHCLNFDGHNKPFQAFQNFVNRSLILWRGIKVLKFSVSFNFQQSATSDLNTWLRFAIEKGVEELYVNLLDPKYEDLYTSGDYYAPRRLYSCSWLKKLCLSGCHLVDNLNVHWDQLQSLQIDTMHLSEGLINRILVGSPKLEVLTLHFVESFENLNIQSSSLRKLKIEKDIDDDAPDLDPAMYTELSIWAPSVETLEIKGIIYSTCLLRNISSISSATVCFYVPVSHGYDKYSGYQLFEELLGQVSQSTGHIDNFTLSDWCIKMLGEMKKEKKDLLVPLSNAKSLKLYARKVHEIVDVVDAFDIFPRLTTLVLEQSPWENDDFYYHCFEFICGTGEPFVSKLDVSESETYLRMPYLLHLKTVEIAWDVCDDSIFSFMKTILKYARKLEKMVFRATAMKSVHVPRESLVLVAQELLAMQRSFPTVTVVMCNE